MKARTVVPGVKRGERYKYHVVSHHLGYSVDKADPLGAFHEVPPRTASVVWQPRHEWRDQAWMAERRRRPPYPARICQESAGQGDDVRLAL